MIATNDLSSNRCHLCRRFAKAEDDFWKPLPDIAMMIHLGKPKVFKGLLTKCGSQPIEGFRRVYAAIAYLFQKGTQLFRHHGANIPVLLTLHGIDSYYDGLGWGQKPPS
jgi:hypothetical protein